MGLSRRLVLYTALLLAVSSLDRSHCCRAVEAKVEVRFVSRLLSLANGRSSTDDDAATDDDPKASPYGIAAVKKTGGSAASSSSSEKDDSSSSTAAKSVRTPTPAPPRGPAFTAAPSPKRKPVPVKATSKTVSTPASAIKKNLSAADDDDDSTENGSNLTLLTSTSSSSTSERASPTSNKLSSSSSDKSSSNNNITASSSSNMTEDLTTDDGADAPPTEWIYANETDDTYMLNKHNSSSLLPPEPEQPDGWAASVAGLFAAMALVLCALTGVNTWRQHQRRRDYEQVSELIV